MKSDIESQLQTLGLELPQAATPVANYVPYIIHQNLVYISGQLPMLNGTLQYAGPLNTLETGQKAAQLCALNLLAQLKNACGGDWNRIKGCLRLSGFIHCTNDFTEHAKVMNSASDIMVKLWGDAGRHARTAVGCNTLPLNAMVEIDAIFKYE